MRVVETVQFFLLLHSLNELGECGRRQRRLRGRRLM